jgi:hypothetical protein
MKRAIWILWPSFLVAVAAVGVFFSLFDPMEFSIEGEALASTRLGAYTIGFFVFWAFAACSSGLTCFLQRSAADVNRLCPLEPGDRPVDCPKHEPRSARTK